MKKLAISVSLTVFMLLISAKVHAQFEGLFQLECEDSIVYVCFIDGQEVSRGSQPCNLEEEGASQEVIVIPCIEIGGGFPVKADKLKKPGVVFIPVPDFLIHVFTHVGQQNYFELISNPGGFGGGITIPLSRRRNFVFSNIQRDANGRITSQGTYVISKGSRTTIEPGISYSEEQLEIVRASGARNLGVKMRYVNVTPFSVRYRLTSRIDVALGTQVSYLVQAFENEDQVDFNQISYRRLVPGTNLGFRVRLTEGLFLNGQYNIRSTEISNQGLFYGYGQVGVQLGVKAFNSLKR